MRYAFWLFLVLAFAPQAGAKDEDCTDGTDCLCDTLPGQDANVVGCQDFEYPPLDSDGVNTTWPDTFGGAVTECTGTGLGLPPGEYLKRYEGTCSTCCVNVVKETGCEVSGQTDCVFQGKQTMGLRYRPTYAQGFVGNFYFGEGNDLGMTMAVMYSNNYVVNSSQKKTDEWYNRNPNDGVDTTTDHCLWGCLGGNQTGQPALKSLPFHSIFFGPINLAGHVDIVGHSGNSGSAFGWWPDIPAGYDFERDQGFGEWHCWRQHIKNPGLEHAVIRRWIDDRLIIHIDDVDLRNVSRGTGIDSVGFNTYHNSGYPGSTVAYRYEDNIVVSRGPDPVTCETIGFDFGAADNGDLKLSSATYSVGESGNATITVTRSGGSDGAVGATVSTSNGTATAGSDYTTTSQAVSFPDGVTTSQTVNIPITTDATDEDDETVNITLGSATGGATLISPTSAVLTIVDDDDAAIPGSLKFSSATFTAAEGGGNIVVTVSRVGGTSGTVGATVHTDTGGAIPGTDYTAVNEQVSLANGVTSDTVNIPLTEDLLDETTEDIGVFLTAATGGAVLIEPTFAIAYITDNDDSGDVSIDSATYMAAAESGVVTVTVTRANGDDGAVGVTLNTIPQSQTSAIPGVDYTSVSQVLNWADGVSGVQTVDIPILADSISEPNETFLVYIANDPGGMSFVQPWDAVVTIPASDGVTESKGVGLSVNPGASLR